MSISKIKPDELNKLNNGTLMERLGIEYLEVAEGYIKARMPVDKRTVQPAGILHGGASLALAETIAGLGSYLMIDRSEYEARGMSVHANHIGTASKGYVIAEAEIIHYGNNSHIWNVTISDESGEKISICRITNIILKK